jgi:hypothetical protein
MRSIPSFLIAAAVVGCAAEHDLRTLDPGADGTPTTEDGRAPGQEAVPGEPVADAGPDFEVRPLDEVTLDATASYDPDGGEIVAVEWTLVMVPAGSTATLDDPTSARPTFFADLAGDYGFQVTVRNEKGVWDSTPDPVLITATPADGFYVELSWDSASDLDLHLAADGAALFSPGDTSYCNATPSWGAGGVADDPSLDWDAIWGFGPETITIDEPSAGEFHVRVHYYGEEGFPQCHQGCDPSRATVNVYLGGVLAQSFTRTLSEQGEVWDVADIEWPSGRITEIDATWWTPETSCF